MHKHDAHHAVGGDYRPDGMREQGFEEGGNVGLLRTVQGRRDRVGVESVRARLFVFSLSLSLSCSWDCSVNISTSLSSYYLSPSIVLYLRAKNNALKRDEVSALS